MNKIREDGPIVGLVALSAFLRGILLGKPTGALIGDEVWYVQAARVIAGLRLANLKNLPVKAWSGIDPNAEHPPLAKVILAACLKRFGNNDVVWRVPSMILGTLGVFLLYLIARRLGARKGLAFFAAFVLSFESLSYIHGRIATLDIYFVTFILLGTWLYLSVRYELAGVAFGVAGLCKVNGMFGLFAVILYDMLVAVEVAMARARATMAPRDWKGFLRATVRGLRPTWRGVRPALSATVFAVGFFLVGLGALDNYVTEFTGPFEHLSHMVHYHVGLTHHGATSGAQSTPLDWWVNEGQINYYTWTDGKDDHVWYRAAMNEYVIWAAPFALLYAGKRAWTDGSKLALFALASFICNFGPPLAAWIFASRTSYIYYMVPSIPAFALAIAAAAEKLPRVAWWVFAGAMLYSFAYSFPVHPLTVHSP